VRTDEGLDAKKIEEFLKDHAPEVGGKLHIEQFPSGFSNLTYLIRAGSRDLVLRRPPFGTKAKTAHDMGREYRILSALHPIFPYCPKPIVYTEDESVIGCPFYIMERNPPELSAKRSPEGVYLYT